MKKCRLRNQKFLSNAGFVVPFCGMLLLVLFGMASFMIDTGHARYQLRNIQIAADASSRAALIPLQNPSPDYPKVRDQVFDIANRNGVAQAEIVRTEGGSTVVGIECGTWSGGVFNSQGIIGGIPTCNGSSKAVQVSIKRQVKTFFGKILNTQFITPATTAVSTMIPKKQCIKPFGINQSFLTGIPINGQITVDRSAPGNWGKLDFGEQFSMTGNSCDEDVHIGGSIDTETGFSRLKTAFNAIEGTSAANGIIIALTSPFPNGGSNPVTILEFVKVNFISSSGNGNSTWTATFQIIERNVSPDPDPDVSVRTLVK